jgi:hypothetical protein
MMDFYNRQTTFVKGLIIAVIVLVVAFLVQQIYTRFIKNGILREMYEDIKIVIESTCPAGYYFNSTGGLDKCSPCLFPNAVNETGDGCDMCKQFEGKAASKVFDTTLSRDLGVSCVLCTGGVPDPDPSFGGCNTNIIVKNLTGSNMYSLVSTTNSTSNYKNYMMTLSLANDKYETDNTLYPYNPSLNQYNIGGVRTLVFNIEGTNNIFNQISDPSKTDLNNMYTNDFISRKQEVISFMKFLYNTNLDKLKNLMTYSSGITSGVTNPNFDQAGFEFRFIDSNGDKYEVGNLDNTNAIIRQIEIKSRWTCGTPSTTNVSNSCLPAGSTITLADGTTTTLAYESMNKYINYQFDPQNNQTYNAFTANCPIILEPRAICDLTSKQCELNKSNNTPDNTQNFPPSIEAAATTVVDGSRIIRKSGTYLFKDVYTYKIKQRPEGTGLKCQELTYKDNDGSTLYSAANKTNELTVDSDLGIVTLVRQARIQWEGSLNSNVPGQLTSTSGKNYLDLNTTYNIYKTGGTTISTTAGTNVVSPYASNLLPIITIKNTNSSESYSNLKRTTVIDATRNVNEPLIIETNSSKPEFNDPANVYPLLSDLLVKMGLISNLSLIKSVAFSSKEYPNANTQTSLQAGVAISPLTAVPSIVYPTLSSTNFATITSPINSVVTASGGVSPKVSVVTPNNNIYNLSGTNYLSVPFTNIYSNIRTNKVWTWISNGNGGLYQTATAYGEDLYRSYDAGKTWFASAYTSNTTPLPFAFGNGNGLSQVCMSNDGTIQYAISNPGYIYYSSDSGITWTNFSVDATNPLASVFNVAQNWGCIACSSNGTVISAAVKGGKVYLGRATLSGLSTFAVPLTTAWNTDVNGNKVGLTLNKYASFNMTWTNPAVSANSYDVNEFGKNWQQISVSNDGIIQLAVISGSKLLRSVDGGNNWSYDNTVIDGNTTDPNPNKRWVDVEVSRSNSNNAVAVDNTFVSGAATQNYDNAIYYTKDAGLTWTSIPASKGAASQNWSSVDVVTEGSNTVAYISSMQGKVYKFTFI